MWNDNTLKDTRGTSFLQLYYIYIYTVKVSAQKRDLMKIVKASDIVRSCLESNHSHDGLIVDSRCTSYGKNYVL